MWKYCFYGLLILAFASSRALCGPNEELDAGTAAFERGDYKTAVRLLTPLAEKGYVVAQVAIGDMYAEGQGVSKDLTKAISWYRKAADTGYFAGQLALGRVYQYGEGVSQDLPVASSWYRKAADQGSAVAQYALGEMYASGQGLQQNLVEAYKWLLLAAEQRNRPYVFQNIRDDATGRLRALQTQLTPSQISEAKRLATTWRPKAF